MGGRCKLYDPDTGKSQKLGRYHRSTICDRCRVAGYTPGDAPALTSNAPPDNEPSTDRHRKCQYCGKPAVAGYTGWKPLFTNENDIDHDLGDVYFCNEHWEQLHEERFIPAAFVPADEPSQPPEEAFGEVFEAARVLFDENITEEDLIIPTLAFANQASALLELKAMRERFAEIADDHKRQGQFADDFQQIFRGLTPIRVSDNVLILEGVRLSLDVSRYPDTAILKEIEIDVFMRSVKPEDVERHYKQTLVQEGVPYNESSEGSCGYRSSDTYVSIVVSPVVSPNQELTTDQVARFLSRGRQLTFPPPELIRKFYASLKGSVYGGMVRGFSHILGGRQSGDTARADNLIPACVAWYLRERGGIADDHRLATLLNRELLAKCNKPEVRVSSGQAIWKSIDKVGDSIKRIEVILDKGLSLS